MTPETSHFHVTMISTSEPSHIYTFKYHIMCWF